MTVATEDKATEAMVLHEVRDGIARITLNRPEAANALAPEQRNRLIELFEADSQDPAVRVRTPAPSPSRRRSRRA